MSNGNQARRRDIEFHIQARRAARWSKEPLWQILFRLLLKFMGFFIIGMSTAFAIALPVMYWNAGGYIEISKNLQENYTTSSLLIKLRNQVSVLERKVEDGVNLLGKEFDEKLEKEWDEMDRKLKAFTGVFEKLMEEFDEELKKAGKNSSSAGGQISVDFSRKEIGLGMADYALASTGGRVVRHSKPYEVLRRWVWWMNRNKASAKADKMIRPGFGVPGRCFALKGMSGFIEIRLSAAIVPLAVTLEHVTKGMAHYWLNAPHQCRVSGWMQGEDSTNTEIGNKFLLTEFTYDIEKSHAQTFMVDPTAYNLVVDTIRLDFYSNHGNASHTCVYRLRVHGDEQNALL